MRIEKKRDRDTLALVLFGHADEEMTLTDHTSNVNPSTEIIATLMTVEGFVLCAPWWHL